MPQHEPTLEEIKAFWTFEEANHEPDDDLVVYFRWLIAEVERLRAENRVLARAAAGPLPLERCGD